MLIVVEAVARLSDPPDVGGAGVLVLGLRRPGRQRRGDLGARRAASGRTSTSRGCCATPSADALSSLGVVVAGAVVLATGWNAADPLASLLIAVLIAAGSWRLLKEPSTC